MTETNENSKSSVVEASKAGGSGESGSGATSTCPYAKPAVDIDHIFDGELKDSNPSNPNG